MGADSMIRFVTITLLVLLPAGLFIPPAIGRVFRITGETHGRFNAAGLPWESAHETTMTVNGRKNDVVVYSVRYSEPVLEQLRAQFERQGATVTLTSDANGGAKGLARWDGGSARILVLAPESRPNNLVFLFYPSRSPSSAAQPPVPDYPRGHTENTMVNNDTEAFCTILSTTDPAGQVQRHYAESLVRDGWKPLLPLPFSAGLSFYHRKESTCCVQTGTRENGETVVTVLVRDKGF